MNREHENVGDAVNEVTDPRSPDPDSGVIERKTDHPEQGRDESQDAAQSSRPPGAHTGDGGPRTNVDRAQPYDEQLIGLRMEEQPLAQPQDS